MAYQVDDALADIVFTFGEYNDDFFYYSNSLGIQSTLWPTTRNGGIQPLSWNNITKFYSVAFRPGLDVFVAYRDSQEVDHYYLRLPGTKPYEKRKLKSDADLLRAETGLRRLDRWIATDSTPPQNILRGPTLPDYANLRLVFGPKRDKMQGNPEANPWGGCYFARSTAIAGKAIWNDLPRLCQESLDARRRNRLNSDPLLMAIGLGGSYVTLWRDLSHDRYISAWYPTLERFFAQNHGQSHLVDIVLAPKSQDTFYARLYNLDRGVYVSFFRGPISRADLLQLNGVLKAIGSEMRPESKKPQEFTVIVTDSQRGRGSRAINLPEYGVLDLEGISFVSHAETRMDERLKTGSEVIKIAAEVTSASSSCSLM